MPQPSKSEAIATFLRHSTHADLSELYNYSRECQVNVSQDSGEAISGEYQGRQWRGFSDGLTTWKPFRIPWNAMSDPHYEDSPMTYDLAAHAEGIGMTGWDWENKVSKWVAFDFDAITGHSDRHSRKNTDAELQAIRTALSSIPWITLRFSTSGSGLHVYIFLEDVPTATHTEHQALARSILSMLSAMTGFDFTTKVDICGGNMWVWHRKMVGTRGLQLISKGGTLTEIPTNWRDHLLVTSGHSKRVVPHFVPEGDTEFEELSGQRPYVSLDSEHRRLIEWLQNNSSSEFVWWWDIDHHMLVTHTKLLEQAHQELSLKGVFKTTSKGTSQQNCFLFPLKKGSWSVRRYSIGVAEDISWTQDGAGYTKCYYNRIPNLGDVSRAFGANETKNGAFAFKEAGIAIEAALLLGAEVNLPPGMRNRRTKMKVHKDGRLYVEVEKQNDDNMSSNEYPGWVPEGKNWSKLFNVKVAPTTDLSEVGDYDEIFRHLVSIDGEDLGWSLKCDQEWVIEPLTHIRMALANMGHKATDINSIIGASVLKHWRLINRPFHPEYPGNRQWNRRAPQLIYTPTLEKDNLEYTAWTKILNHLGSGLNDAVARHGWCKANGILTGADYLKLWCASLFQCPNEPLPYLFFYGKENCGKSMFHESIKLLVTHGVARADNALTDQRGFNGELEGAILCVVEEIDLSKSKVALNRIKDWLLSTTLPIHIKGQTPINSDNTTHWVQCANAHTYCPVTIGDTRITMCHVPDIPFSEQIPRRLFIPTLKKQAPDFLAALFSMEIPQNPDRLMVPILETEIKRIAARSNRTQLEAFIDAETHYAPGYTISFKEFYDKFQNWVDISHRVDWNKWKVSREMPPEFRIGRFRETNSQHIGNISWDPPQEKRPLYKLETIKSMDYLVLEEVVTGGVR